MNKKPAGSFYRHIVRDAWEIVRKRRVLWVLGFFVAFLGNGGIYELLIQGTGRLGLRQDFGGVAAFVGILPSGPELLNGIQRLGAFDAAASLLMLIAVLAVFGIALWVVISSQGGLLTGIRDAHRGRTLRFGNLFGAGNEVFWPLLWLNLLSRLAITSFFYLLLSVLVLLMSDASVANATLYLVAFLILVPLTLIIGFVGVFAASYITLYRMRFIEAVETALALFRAYWLISLETAVILFAVNIAVALGLTAVFVALGTVFLIIFGFLLGASSAAAWIFMAIAAVLALALLVMTGAGLAAYQHTVWTLLFLKLNQRGHGGIAKIVRLFERFLGRR